MRRSVRDQLPLVPTPFGHDHARELQAIRVILDAHPEFARWVQADLLAGGIAADRGRDGMTGRRDARLGGMLARAGRRAGRCARLHPGGAASRTARARLWRCCIPNCASATVAVLHPELRERNCGGAASELRKRDHGGHRGASTIAYRSGAGVTAAAQRAAR
jgi:hypothetical protein